MKGCSIIHWHTPLENFLCPRILLEDGCPMQNTPAPDQPSPGPFRLHTLSDNELRILCAERVMKWERQTAPSGTLLSYSVGKGTMHVCICTDKDCALHDDEVWNPLIQPLHLDLLIDRITSHNSPNGRWNFSLDTDNSATPDGWSAVLWRPRYDEDDNPMPREVRHKVDAHLATVMFCGNDTGKLKELMTDWHEVVDPDRKRAIVIAILMAVGAVQ